MKKITTFLLAFASSAAFCQEVCDNAVDDDGDGLTDLNDPDCSCQAAVPSLIPNASFEEYTACPSDFSQLELCTGWMQASVPTTDYQHTCNFVFEALETAGMVPFPHGNGIAGGIIRPGYREYLGRCLPQPMLAGTDYRLTFNIASVPNTNHGETCNNGIIDYEPISITLYGNTNCSQLPVADAWRNPNATDPTWFVIGSAYYEPSSTWGELTINFTPGQNIRAIILGAPEYVPDSYETTCNPYFVYDNLSLNNSASFGVTVTQSGHYCENNLSLNATLTSPVSGVPGYQWYKNGVAIIGETGPSLSLLSAPSSLTDFTVKVTDEDGCVTSNAYTVYDVIPAPEFTYTVPTCIVETGSVTITSPAAFYSFDDGATWQTGPTNNSLQPGFYFLRTKSATGCISEYATIGLYTPVVNDYPQYTVANVTCTSGGNITITSPAHEYSFDGGVTWQQSPILQNPELDHLYVLVMRSADGCQSNNTYAYAHSDGSVPTAPQINITQPSSCNEQTGVITGVYDDLDFSFDDGATWTTDHVSGPLLPGTYYVRTKYPNGCMSPPTIAVINAPADAPATPQFTVANPTCTIPTGTITITTQNEHYSFDNGNTWVSTNSKAGLPPGSYSVKVKNADGCQSDPAIAVISDQTGPPPAPSYSVDQPDCFTATGVITITAPAHQFSFDNGNTWTASNISAALSVGNYLIRIKNAAGCESPSVEIIVTPEVVPPPVTADIIYCKNSLASALSATGDNLLWYTLSSGGVASVIPPVPSTATAGTFSYYVTQTINGCESSRATINVEVLNELDPPAVNSGITYCQDDTALPLSAAGQNLLWYTGAGNTGSSSAPVPATDVAGTFQYNVTQSAYGCESAMATITLTVLSTPPPPETSSSITYQHYSTAIQLNAQGSQLSWYDEDYNHLDSAPVPSTNAIGQSVYYVSQTVNGCESELVMITVNIVKKHIQIDYPKFFSPNSDGLHDSWNIRPIGNGRKATVYIFDRYGRVLAKVYSPGAGWDGSYNGKALPATDYWFKATYTEYGNEKEFKGHFSLLR